MDRNDGAIGQAFERLAHDHQLVVERPQSAYGSAWALLSREASGGASVYRYAYALWWHPENEPTLGDTVAWVLLNPIQIPSGVTRRRPTLGYCRNQTQHWKHGGLVIVNLFAYRADTPDQLRELAKGVAGGPHNDQVLEAVSRMCAISVAAWGKDGGLGQRSRDVRELIDNLHCVAGVNGPVTTRTGEPCHPRRLPRLGTLSRLP